MKIRALIGVWLVALMGLAMCGAGLPDIGLSSNQGRYKVGLKTSLANGGGGAAWWDTITIVFTTQDVLTAGVLDTTKVGTASSPSAPYDSQRRDTFKFWLAQADTIHRLGSGFKVTNFAYGLVDSTEPEGYAYPSGYQVGMLAGLRVGGGPYTHNREFAVSGRRAELFYIPYEKYIPHGSTIVGAHVNVSGNTASTATTADSVYANLVTSADSKWYTSKRGGSVADYSKMGWSRQISNNPTGSITWSATNSDPWSTALSLRDGFRDWGDVEDQTALPGAVSARQQLVFSLKNCVQAAVTGATNNGTILNLGWKTNAFQGGLNHAFWDDTSDAVARTPYVVVRYLKRRYMGAADITAPAAPTGLLAYGADTTSVLLWTPSASPDYGVVNVYRSFDGSSFAKIGESTLNSYFDLTAINGSPHYYRVTASDRSGNESAAGDIVETTPGTILPVSRPAYYALWFADPGASVSSAQLDSLAMFDAIVTGPFAMEGAAAEPAYTGMLADLRSRNHDIIVLQYAHPWVTRTDGETAGPVGSPYKRMVAYANTGTAGSDSLGYVCNTAGQIVRGHQYPKTRYLNFMRSACADTVAKIWVDAYENNSRMSGEYTGLFVDDVTLSPTMTVYDVLASGDDSQALTIFDADNDNTVFASDAQEKAALLAYHESFMRALRREFAERGLQNRLIVANSDLGRATSPSQTALDVFSLLDGNMIEGPNVWFPGNAASDTTWDRAFAVNELMTHAQISPAMQMFQVRADSSIAFMTEVLALANDSWVCSNDGYSEQGYGSGKIPSMVRRLPTPGSWSAPDYAEGGADPDTLTAPWTNYTARMLLQRNASAPADTYAVWPYLITRNSDGTILSRSAFWELPEEVGPPPPSPQFVAVGGDNQVTVTWSDAAYPADFSHVHIYRTPYANVDSMRLFISDPIEAFAAFGDQAWTDVTAANDSQYCYSVAVVDMNGQESELSDFDCATPDDSTAPPIPLNLKVAGGDGFVDLDWNNVVAADIVGYYISRALDDGDGNPGTFTARQDSVTISAHQDSTAISGQWYHYYVRAYDDDGNISATSDTVSGGWIGSPPATYLAPQLVRVLPNYTATATAVLVYPPNDVTGLTGYTVYRGPWNGIAATDTTACIKRISINAAPDAFNAHTYIDNTANTSPDSAFQYTAVALYSGNRSAKYSPPAGAFTDGGFAATTPTLAAFGNGTNILLAVGTVSGADSTRVYRGTSAVAQTSLASINAANNPYTDTTAAANTDYWYKVRQYDVQTAAWSNYSTVSGPVRWTSVPSGTPSISGVNEGVDNTVQHGEAVVIAGSNFGVNDVAADFSDGFESGAFQSPWNLSDGGYSQGFSTVVAAGANARHGASSYVLKTSFPSTSGNAHQCIYRDPFTTLYAQYWVKLDNNFDFGGPGSSNNYGPTELANVKFFRLWPYGSSQEDFVTAFHKYLTTHGAVVEVENTDPYPHSWYAWGGFANPGEFTKNVWHLFQFEYRSSSGLGVADGVFKWTVDGDVKFSRSDIVTMKNTNTPKDEVWLGFGDTTSGWNYDGANDVYFDDIYITPTFARVELGTSTSNPSNPTYAQCDHREIQAPTDWTSTSVSITANTGSFADGNVYLFVIDEDGTASPGQLVTIDNP